MEIDGELGLALQGGSYVPGDWESSGIIDVSDILGPDQLLVNVQAHYSVPGIIQDGQLLVMRLGDACAADCDQSTGAGVLDMQDFLCFQTAFANGDPYACDCDRSTGMGGGNGACDIFDFLCFQDSFVNGCP